MVNYILNFYINIKIKNLLWIRRALVNKINKLKEIISQINQNWIWANLKYNPPIIINKQFFNQKKIKTKYIFNYIQKLKKAKIYVLTSFNESKPTGKRQI